VQKRSAPPPDPGDSTELLIAGVSFVGATPEHESLLRKVWMAREGKFFDDKLFQQSIEKMNQLGFFEPLSERDGQHALKL